MDFCDTCGGEIIFRWIDGRVVPIHAAGECLPSRQGSARPSEPAKQEVSVSRFYSIIQLFVGGRDGTCVHMSAKEAHKLARSLLAAAEEAEKSPPPPRVKLPPLP